MAAGMMAAPMSYSIEGEQYIAILSGVGGGIGQVHVPGSAAYEYGNKGRLIVLSLGALATSSIGLYLGVRRLCRRSSSLPNVQ